MMAYRSITMSDDRENAVVEKVTPDEAVPPDDKDARRLKKALSSLQKEKADLEKQLTDFRKEIEESKLTEQQKVAKELETLRNEVAKRDNDRKALEAEIARERRVSVLVAKHGLADPDFADVVLKKWNPDEHEDFDKFAASLKKDEKYARLFTALRADPGITNEDGSKIIPNSTVGMSNRSAAPTGRGGPSDEDEQIARDLFPNSPAKQKQYLENLQRIKRGK